MSKKRMVGVFKQEEHAIKAIQELKTIGYKEENISFIAKSKETKEHIEEATHASPEKEIGKAAGTGAVAGGAIGAIGALLVQAGTFAIPGIGPILAAGPLAATIAGLAAGGATGGVVGALAGLGINKDDAEKYHVHLESGDVLVLVDSHEENIDQVFSTFVRHEALEKESYEGYKDMPKEPIMNSLKPDVTPPTDPLDSTKK